MEEQEIVHCGRCGRELKNVKAKEDGFGRCCLKKVRAAKAEFEKNQQQLFKGDENNE